MRVALAVLVLAACGPAADPCPFREDLRLPKPQLCPDRESVGFSREFIDYGVRIGAERLDSIGFTNGGRETLKFEVINLDGPLDFTIRGDPPAELASGNFAGVTLVFAPREVGMRRATLNVRSNAENVPFRTFAISGCASPADAGDTSTCR